MPATVTKLITCVGVCLATTGLTFGDTARPKQVPAASPQVQSKPDEEKPGDKTKKLEPAVEPELITKPPASVTETTGGQVPQHGRPVAAFADEHIGPGNTIWANLEYLFWWTKDGPLPVPLVVSSAGSVIGDTDISYDNSPGGRLTVGTWLDVPHHVGIEASGFVIARNRVTATLASDAFGNPSIARPIIDASTNTPASYLVSFPNVYAGSATVSSQSRFWGAETNLVRNLFSDYDCEFDLLLGFRYIDLDENLNIDQTTTILPGGVITFNNLNQFSGTLSLTDRFSARNNLFLGQVGARTSFNSGPFAIDVMCKVGFGPNIERIRIDGSSQFAGPAITASTAGGLLALAGTNIGQTRTSWFSVVPEVGAQLGWSLTSCVNLHVGYSFLYLNSVVRPGDQINVAVNPAFVPTSSVFGSQSAPAEPSPLFRRTEYWVHGINAGVLLRY